MTEEQVLVSFADGAGRYAKALMRLELSLKQTGFKGRFYGINDYGHIDSPHHLHSPGSVPYAFKAYSIRMAMEAGHRYILWTDSEVYASQSIQPIFDHIREHGYLIFDNIGFSASDYTSDMVLNKYGISREDGFRIKMINAKVMGFDTQNDKAKEFIKEYIAAAVEGWPFIGSPFCPAERSWMNDVLQVSQDLRCKGSRHDQSIGTCLVHNLKMDITNSQETFFANEAHKGILHIADTVSLWAGPVQ